VVLWVVADAEVPKLGAPSPGGGGARAFLFCTRDTYFERNETWRQDKIYILVGTLLDLIINLALFYNLNFTKI
jgi:hypothetical protein